MNPEKEIELRIKELLGKLGFFCFKINQPGFKTRNIRGVADLFAIKDGVSYWIEIKTATGQLSIYQEKFRDNILNSGGNYLVVHNEKELTEGIMPLA